VQFGRVDLSLYNMSPCMDSWKRIEENGLTFEALFQQGGIPVPEDRSASRSIKDLSLQERVESGPSLQSLGELRVDQLTLSQGSDHSWAMEKLSTYGPDDEHLVHWDPRVIECFIPDYITDENSVIKYLEESFLYKAMCGGFFLFHSATNLAAEPKCCPRKGLRLADRSGYGSSGRPDRQIDRNEKPCCLMEFKTGKVCMCGEIDVLDMKDVCLPYKNGGNFELGLTGVEKKKTTLAYQVCWFSRVFVLLIILESPGMASATDSKVRTFNCRQRKKLYLGHPERQYTYHIEKIPLSLFRLPFRSQFLHCPLFLYPVS
jgi:hypothetical protein